MGKGQQQRILSEFGLWKWYKNSIRAELGPCLVTFLSAGISM